MENEVNEHVEHLPPVKSVFTVLRYLTKASVGTIKTAKKVDGLEADYMKIRLINRQEMIERFAALETIISFTPGMKSMMLNIALRLNKHNSPPESTEDMKKNILELVKPVRAETVLFICSQGGY